VWVTRDVEVEVPTDATERHIFTTARTKALQDGAVFTFENEEQSGFFEQEYSMKPTKGEVPIDIDDVELFTSWDDERTAALEATLAEFAAEDEEALAATA